MAAEVVSAWSAVRETVSELLSMTLDEENAVSVDETLIDNDARAEAETSGERESDFPDDAETRVLNDARGDRDIVGAVELDGDMRGDAEAPAVNEVDFEMSGEREFVIDAVGERDRRGDEDMFPELLDDRVSLLEAERDSNAVSETVPLAE